MRWLPRSEPETKGTSGGRGGQQTFRAWSSPPMMQWTPDRSMREAMQRVTWVFRCIDAIASNQAKLPLIWRQGDAADGPEIVQNELDGILNSKTNLGEDSYSFRYRLSAQLLLSSQGVFIEVVRNRAGQVLAMMLLQPQWVTPIRDRKTFVSGYKIKEPGQEEITLKAEQVIWIRKPHPFDPYQALTPLESAGLAIESDWLYKLYNRNFLLNDGRPGGLIVVKGLMNEGDKEELRSRYRGNINTVGRIGVIASDEGADFVDTAISMRDAAYIEGRQLTKEEILMAFGVPESVLANASGRTFDNAEQERLIFWMETMNANHLPLIARPLDVLDPDPKHLAAFDTSRVDVIQRAEIKRRDFLLKEVQFYSRTPNEYRLDTGQPKFAQGGDEVYILNTYTPIAGTTSEAVGAAQDVIAAGRPPEQNATSTGRPQDSPTNQSGSDPESPGRPAGTRKPRPAQGEAAKQMYPEQVVPVRLVFGSSQEEEPPAAKVKIGDFLVHEEDLTAFKAQTLSDYERWETIVERTLQRFFERQERVIGEKVLGAKMRTRIAKGSSWTGASPVDTLFDEDNWNDQLKEDLTPLLMGISQEFGDEVAHALQGMAVDLETERAVERREVQIDRLLKVNRTTGGLIQDAVKLGLDLEETPEEIATRVTAVFVDAKEVRASRITITEVVAAASTGKLLAAAQKQEVAVAATGTDGVGVNTPASKIEKMWVATDDDHVRESHVLLDGKVVGLDEPFEVDGVQLLYPGDPDGPPDQTIQCRCALSIVEDGVPLLS